MRSVVNPFQRRNSNAEVPYSVLRTGCISATNGEVTFAAVQVALVAVSHSHADSPKVYEPSPLI